MFVVMSRVRFPRVFLKMVRLWPMCGPKRACSILSRIRNSEEITYRMGRSAPGWRGLRLGALAALRGLGVVRWARFASYSPLERFRYVVP